MKTITARQGQTIYDLAIKHYGDIEGIDWILEDNPGLDIENEIDGMQVILRDDVKNQVIVDQLKNKQLTTY